MYTYRVLGGPWAGRVVASPLGSNFLYHVDELGRALCHWYWFRNYEWHYGGTKRKQLKNFVTFTE